MERLKYDNQLCRQCFNIPAMCQEQVAGVVKGMAESVPAEILKGIRRAVVAGYGDPYLAGAASAPVFERYTGASTSQFIAVRCIEAARYTEIGEQQAAGTLPVGVSASGGPTRLVEAFHNVRRKGCHTVIVTNHADSPCAREVEYSLTVNTLDFPEPGPGFCNYYASVLGLPGLAAAMGEAKGACSEGAMAELMEKVWELVKEYGERLEEIDGQTFALAGRWKEYRAVEMVGGSTSPVTSYFVSAKYAEAAGAMASTTDTEDWCHANYFKHGPGPLGVIITAHGGGPNRSCALETTSQAEGVGRSVLLVTDESKEKYGVKGRAGVCMIPKAPAGYEFLVPLLDYLPGTLLVAYVVAYREEPYFRGADSRQRQSKVGCTIKDSEIWAGQEVGRMREKASLCRPGMGGVMDTVMVVIVCSGIREGVCVITVLDDRAVVIIANREKADIRQDIMEDSDRMVPARVNRRGWMVGEADDRVTEVIKAASSAVAKTKVAMTGGSLDVIAHEGIPLLAPDQGISAVDYRGGEEVELAILCG